MWIDHRGIVISVEFVERIGSQFQKAILLARRTAMSIKSLVAGLLLTIGLAIPCQAQFPFAPWGGGAWGYGGSFGSFRNNTPVPPYFAIHPPVYYGKRYQRPYGDSPYASLSTLQPNPGYMPTPRAETRPRIINPYYDGMVVPEETAPSGPVTVKNPFFKE